jgi:hypothetical protein
MNDFTKEELQNIYDAIGHLVKFHANHNLTTNLELRIKIQSMIDNYCKCLIENRKCTGGWTWMCTKCGKKTGDETQ